MIFTLNIQLGAALGLVGVAPLSVQTPTLSHSADHLTHCIGPTHGPLTGVDTLPVAAVVLTTGQTGSTVSVSLALIGLLTASSSDRVSDISGQTGADCDDSLAPALREWSTGVRQAGVDTL